MDGYEKLINIIKQSHPDCNIYISSLLPATKEIIYEDLESPLPQKIYNGKSFDIALENHKFDNAIYVDTKWMVKDNLHKDDGVHMKKEFYDAYIPFITYYTLLYSDYLNDELVESKKTYETSKDVEEVEISDESKAIHSTINKENKFNKIANEKVVGIDDIYYFDCDEQWEIFEHKYGKEALKVFDDSIFIGDSHIDRLLRPIVSKIIALCKPKRTLRQLEKEINQASIMDQHNIIIYTGNNEVFTKTDLLEYEYEYRYIHDMINDKKDVYICSYFTNIYGKSKSESVAYDNVIKKVCSEFENFHYVDLSKVWKKEYVTNDNHLNFRFNIQALELLLLEMNKVNGNKISVDNDIDIVLYNENIMNGINNDILNNEFAPIESQKTSIVNIDEVIKLGKINNTDIEWIKINENDNEKTLLSKYIYLNLPYNNLQESITWESSSLRKYLNEVLYNEAFIDIEKKIILKTKVDNIDNDITEQDGGNDTYDFVFIPSIKEIEKYVEKDEGDLKKKKLATKYAFDNDKSNIYINKSKGKWYEGNSPYWLRTPGLYDDDAAYVNYNGDISYNGLKVSFDKQGVRLMIKIKKVKE